MAAAKKKDEVQEFQSPTEQGLSTQAQFSTYSENTDLPDDNPPPGPHVVQELGKPKAGPVEYDL